MCGFPATPYHRKDLNKRARWSRVVLVRLETNVWGMAMLHVERFPDKTFHMWYPHNSAFCDNGDCWDNFGKENGERFYISTGYLLGEGRRVTHWAHVTIYKKRKKSIL
jgi:hypothetical protein